MRKLVTIRKVEELVPIDGADVIELAKIDGWQCVVKKGEFEKGGWGLYFEIDSFLPLSDSRFEFLRPRGRVYKNKEGYKVKTMRLRGALSQGLFMPLNVFPEIKDIPPAPTPEEETDSIADALGIEKWEPDQGSVPLNAKGSFPAFIKKTDQERVQNLMRTIEAYQDRLFEVTIKLDGSSTTVYNHSTHGFGVSSRNLDLKPQEGCRFWSVNETYGLEESLKEIGRNIALQGELMGPGIQKNREQFSTLQYFLFDIWNIDANRYMGTNERYDFLALLNERRDPLKAELRHVPILHKEFHIDIFKTVEDYLAFAEGPSLNAKLREGLVFKTLDGQFSFKAISNSYLLKYEE